MHEDFGTLPDGRTVERVALTAGDLTVKVLTLGATLQDVRLAGVSYSLTVGSDDLAGYPYPLAVAGAVVGPVANRIRNAEFTLDGEDFALEANAGPHCLHGGSTGTMAQVWDIAEASGTRLVLTCQLADGLGGFPGNRRLTTTYEVVAPATLGLTLNATTDRPTPINLANHSYWNLGPDASTTGHILTVKADRVMEADAIDMATGRILDVAGTRFDLRTGAKIRTDATAAFDNNFCLSDTRQALRDVALLECPGHVTLQMATTEPGLQVYTARKMNSGDVIGHRGAPYGGYAGVALEAQGWPDAPNQPTYPSITLRPGKTYHQQTRWSFDRAS